MNVSSAATAPAISSLPTLKPRPKPWRGTPFSGFCTNSFGGGHRARPDHGLDLLRLYLAHADAEGTVEETHLDESRAGHVEGLVVGVSVVTADHDLASVLVAVVRHAIHSAHVETRDGRAGGKHERAEGPGRHQACLRPRVARDHAARRLL